VLAVASDNAERSTDILVERQARLVKRQADNKAAQAKARNAAKAKARKKSKGAAKARKRNRK